MVIREVLGHVIRRVGLRDQWRTIRIKSKSRSRSLRRLNIGFLNLVDAALKSFSFSE